jgi:hypothetical protein
MKRAMVLILWAAVLAACFGVAQHLLISPAAAQACSGPSC